MKRACPTGENQAETEKKDTIQEELDHKYNEEPKNAEGARKPFFDWEQDKDGTSLETWIKEKAGSTSKQLRVIRKSIGKNVEHGLSFSMRDDGVMKRKPEEVGRVVVPECLRAYVLRMFHNSQMAAHQGKNRTVKQITESFYWPGMKSDIARWIKACLACTRRKTPRPMRAGIRSYALSGYPNQTIVIDILGPFLQSISGNMWVLTIINHKMASRCPDSRQDQRHSCKCNF